MKIEHEIFVILMPLTSAEAVQEVLEDMGVFPKGLTGALPAPIENLIAQVEPLIDQIGRLAQSLEGASQEDILPIVSEIFTTAGSVYRLVDGLRDAANSPDILTFRPPLSDPGRWEELARQLPGYLLERWVRHSYPRTHEVMQFLRLWKSGAGGFGIDLQQINAYLTAPAPALAALVSNGQSVDLSALVWMLKGILKLSGLARPERARAYVDGHTFINYDEAPARALEFSILPAQVGQFVGLDFNIDFDGQVLDLGMELAAEAEISLPVSDDWTLSADAAGSADIGLRYSVTDGIAFDPGAPAATAGISLVGQPAAAPWRLFGFDKGPKLTLSTVRLEVDTALNAAAPELTALIGFEDLTLGIDMKDGDSFLADAIPMEAFEVSFSAALNWSSLTGLSVTSGGPSAIQIPVNINIGPITIPTVTVEFTPMDQAFGVTFAVSAGADLGFLAVTVNEVGATAMFSEAADGQGLLGDFDLSMRFKPPSGLGLAIGVPNGPISGGGYLNVDHDAGRYEGILDLQVIKVGITAVVIIDTKALESGAWSMFFALFIELPSIQLGFGISLDGVGGVAGIHRTLDPEALLAAARSGAIDSVLFPENPIADAPIIIDTFRSLFPPAQGRYVFGPVVKLGWAKGMVSAEMGVVIELPDPILVAVMGTIKVIMPNLPEQEQPTTPEAEEEIEPAILALRLDMAGVFDFEQGTIAIDAYLHNSAIAGFPISGGMSLRAGFKNDPKFLMALGGFHPGFAQPPNFPDVPRLAMSIEVAGVIEISFENYFAITSNTVQFGAAIHLMADIDIFAIEGGFEFDALFEFNPFHMDIALNMYVSVEAIGIDLMAISLVGTAVGPKPWVITAVAEFSVIGYRDGVEINYGTSGTLDTPAQVPPGVFELVAEALTGDDAWDVVGTPQGGVMFAEPIGADAPPAVAPNAVIAVAQKVAPLKTLIDRFGRNTAIEYTRFEVMVDVPDAAVTGDFEEWFAPGRFRDLGDSDQSQLSAPSFERMPAGKTISGGVLAGAMQVVSSDHKVSRMDPEWDVDPSMFPAPEAVTAEDRMAADAVQLMPTSRAEVMSTVADVDPVDVHEITFLPVNVTTGEAGIPQSFMNATAVASSSADVLVRGFERALI